MAFKLTPLRLLFIVLAVGAILGLLPQFGVSMEDNLLLRGAGILAGLGFIVAVIWGAFAKKIN